MSKKIFVFLGHPDSESMCRDFADAYAKGATSKGHEVRRTNIGDMTFDPILHHGYKVVQEIEPDLKKFQEDVKWSEHLVIVYPSWWSTMPALLKGLFDRCWLPGFAYKFFENGLGWHRLLRGRTGTVFVSSDSSPWMARFLFGDNVNEIRDGILWFAGISARIKKVGPMKKISPENRAKWVEKFLHWGEKAY